ncbi:MAG: hypothetical protein E7645_02025 [Ruminococcaceae bacterium]|nr:hypothetical protein [Oscillospiraceae bacterium]
MKRILISISLVLTLLLTACGRESTSPHNTEESKATNATEAITAPLKTESPGTEASATETEIETESEAEPLKTFKNPLLDRAAPDPCIVYHDGYYYGTFTEALGIALYRSTSLEKVFNDEKVIVFNLNEQIQGNIWAPELFYNPATDRWYIYACGSTQGWDFFSIRMFCLESKTNDPFGEYVFKGYTDPNLLAIDQTMFCDEVSGALYTAYSEFTDRGQVIMLAVMENPWTISDQRIRVSYPRYNWEKRGAREDKDSRVNEGPVFLEKNGKLCLLYSASGCWSQYYCLGLIEFNGNSYTVNEIMDKNNWSKHDSAVFSAANDVYGVGHCTFFTSPNGQETWIAYHGMPTSDAGEEGRYAYAQPITFDENGLPVLGKPLSRDSEISVPAGEVSD